MSHRAYLLPVTVLVGASCLVCGPSDSGQRARPRSPRVDVRSGASPSYRRRPPPPPPRRRERVRPGSEAAPGSAVTPAAPASRPGSGGGDRDGDGIADVDDKCPTVPEDRDGFEDDDGCPDPDNDRDGIPDVRDKCPNDPETVNGYQDDDGCPDKKP